MKLSPEIRLDVYEHVKIELLRKVERAFVCNLLERYTQNVHKIKANVKDFPEFLAQKPDDVKFLEDPWWPHFFAEDRWKPRIKAINKAIKLVKKQIT